MELLAHLSKAIHGRISVLPVAICLVAICTIAICRFTRWVLHALVIGVANGERVNQTNNQIIVGSTRSSWMNFAFLPSLSPSALSPSTPLLSAASPAGSSMLLSLESPMEKESIKPTIKSSLAVPAPLG